MGFADDWKSAKNTFENSTKSKKPSDSFLGVFRKGTGIESALKDADKAKTAGDLKKAIQALKTASAAYMSTLDKSINDPKAVASDAKKAYAEASKGLKGALERIVASAETTAESLANADKKAAVDPAKQRAEANALKAVKEHVALRQRVYLELQKMGPDYSKRGSEIEKSVAQAKQYLANAKAAKSKGETMQAGVAAGVVARFADQAVQQLKDMQTHWAAFAKQGGDLMKAREDGKKSYDDLASSDQHYRKESNDLFAAGDKLQQALQAKMKTLATAVAEATAMAEEAEQYQVTGAGPQVYVKRAQEIKAKAEELVKQLASRVDKANGWESAAPRLKTMDQKGREQYVSLVRTILAKHGEDAKSITLLEGRLKNFPENALDDKDVKEFADKAGELIASFKKDASTVVVQGQKLMKALGG